MAEERRVVEDAVIPEADGVRGGHVGVQRNVVGAVVGGRPVKPVPFGGVGGELAAARPVAALAEAVPHVVAVVGGAVGSVGPAQVGVLVVVAHHVERGAALPALGDAVSHEMLVVQHIVVTEFGRKVIVMPFIVRSVEDRATPPSFFHSMLKEMSEHRPFIITVDRMHIGIMLDVIVVRIHGPIIIRVAFRQAILFGNARRIGHAQGFQIGFVAQKRRVARVRHERMLHNDARETVLATTLDGGVVVGQVTVFVFIRTTHAIELGIAVLHPTVI